MALVVTLLGGCDVGGPSGLLADTMAPDVASEAVTAWIEGEQPFPVSASIIQGYAQVEWEPYSGEAAFEQYRIHVVRSGRTEGAVVGFKESTRAMWVDSAFVGGTTLYAVEVVTSEGSTTARATLRAPVPSIVAHELAETGNAITWTRHRVPGNFAGYVLERAVARAGEPFEPIATFETISDTSFVDPQPVFFGTAGWAYRIRTLNDVSPLVSNRAVFRRGSTFAPFDAADIGPHGLYLLRQFGPDHGVITRYDPASLEVLASREGGYVRDVDAEKQGAFLVALVDSAETIVKLDPHTLDPVSQVPVNDVLGRYDRDYAAENIYIGGQGRAVLISGWWRPTGFLRDGFQLVDLEAEELLLRATNNPYAIQGEVSNDGVYAIQPLSEALVYRIFPTGIVQVASIATTRLSILDDEHVLGWVWGGGEESLSVLTLSGLDLDHTIAVPEDFVYEEVDRTTGFVLGTTPDEALVYDSATGELLLRVPYMEDPYGDPYDMPLRLLGGRLLHKDGYVLSVEAPPAHAVFSRGSISHEGFPQVGSASGRY